MRKYKNILELKSCPHCGHDTYYSKQTYCGEIEYRERFDGEWTDNANMYDNATHKYKSKFYYCANCNKRIARISKKGEI